MRPARCASPGEFGCTQRLSLRAGLLGGIQTSRDWCMAQGARHKELEQ